MRRIALLVCLVGCGGAQRTHDSGDEWLDTIRIEGNHAIPTKELLGGLALRRAQEEGRAADPYQLQQDTERLRGAFLRHGFFNADVTARVEHRGKAQIVVFAITEGKRATTRLEITGLPPEVPVGDVKKLLELDDGEPFDYETYDDAKQPLVERLQNAGYARAELRSRVVADREHDVAIVQLEFVPGTRCTFGEPQVSGAFGELRDALAARVTFHRGETFSAKALESTQQALYEMGRFSTVRIEPDRSGDTTEIPVKVVVAEGNRHERHYGIGVGLDPITWEGRVRAGYSVVAPRLDDHVFDLTTFGIDGRLALAFPRTGLLPDFGSYEPRGRGAMTLRRVDLFRTYMNGDVELGVQYLTLEAYTSYGPHLRLGLDTPIGVKWLQARVAWQLEALWFRALDPIIDAMTAARFGLDHYQRNGTYQEALTLDLRDRPIATRRGVYVALQVTEGTPFAGGALSYVELVPDLRGFLPVGPLVLAARGRVGAIMGDVPVSERFFAGGPTSHRGFPTRTLSPVIAGVVDGKSRSVVIGGAGLIESGLEVRVPLPDIRDVPFETVLFLDGGDVTDRPGELDVRHLHWAVGSGLRVVLGGIPIGFDLGYRLNRKGPNDPNPGSSWTPSLVLGEAY